MSKKGIGRGHGRRQFALEQLESRNLLAGQVTVEKSGDELKVTGDNSSNQVAILWVADDTFAVVGLGTDIKGNNSSPAPGTEVKVVSGIRNISVNLKKGNDLLFVGNNVSQLVALGEGAGVISSGSASAVESALESFLGSAANVIFELDKQLKIRTEDGSDSVVIQDAKIGKRIDADMGSGTNRIRIQSTITGDDIILRAGSGTDSVELYSDEIAQMLDANLGDGKNSMFVDDCDIGESAVVTTGKGNDQIEFYNDTDIELNFIVRMGGGNDEVKFDGDGGGRGEIGRTADINTGAGNDTVEICDADIGIKAGGDEIGWSLKINTEDGIDAVMVGCEGLSPAQVDLPDFGDFSVNIGDDLIINLGSGNDGNNPSGTDGGALIQNTGIVDNFEVHGGSGNDDIILQAVGVGHDAFLRGNDGHDGIATNGLLVGNNLDIDTGSGDDTGELGFIEARRIFIQMGSGADQLVLFQMSADEEFRADGGSDNDGLEESSGDDVDATNFEYTIL